MCFAQGSYDNSFLIADRSEAWVLETVGSEWVARRFGRGATAAISNEPTIRTEWDRRSEGLISHAVAHGKPNAHFRLENIHGPWSGHSQQSVGPQAGGRRRRRTASTSRLLMWTTARLCR